MMARLGAVAGILLVASLGLSSGPATSAVLGRSAADGGKVSSLIVRYRPGVAPTLPDGRIQGTTLLPSGVREAMSLGVGLGNDMWTIKVRPPLTAAGAVRVCGLLERSVAVLSAEPDRKVTALVGRTL